MATDGYWADPVIERERARVYWPTLDSMIAPDDPVRLVDEVLSQVDWSSWESKYKGNRGQPPIHPRFVAAASAILGHAKWVVIPWQNRSYYG